MKRWVQNCNKKSEGLLSETTSVDNAIYEQTCSLTTFICNETEVFQNLSVELYAAAMRLKNKKAPGPGNIPAEVMRELAAIRPEHFLKIYNELAKNGSFREKYC